MRATLLFCAQVTELLADHSVFVSLRSTEFQLISLLAAFSNEHPRAIAGNRICDTCGVQFSDSTQPPSACPVCEDDRQYIGPSGQKWTSLQEMQGKFHNKHFKVTDQVISIGPTLPKFAIGQRALLIKTAQGNVLWDCITLLDDVTKAVIDSLGGISIIAISHPHFYDTMVEWAQAFQCKVLIHQADEHWVMRTDTAAKHHVEFWSGDSKQLNDTMQLVRLGGHFAGSCILHSRTDESFICTGDSIQVTPDKMVSFMYR